MEKKHTKNPVSNLDINARQTRKRFTQLIKEHLQKNPTANIMLNREKTECFLPRTGNN